MGIHIYVLYLRLFFGEMSGNMIFGYDFGDKEVSTRWLSTASGRGGVSSGGSRQHSQVLALQIKVQILVSKEVSRNKILELQF